MLVPALNTSTWLLHSECTVIPISAIRFFFSEELQLVKTMRRLADHDVISRPACYHTLNDTRLRGRMPLHVILSCNNTHLKEVSDVAHSKHFVIYERHVSIPKCPTLSATTILDLIQTNLA
jgi:hypothetical protein